MLIKYNNSLLFTFTQKVSDYDYFYVFLSEGKLISKRLLVIKKHFVINRYIINSIHYYYDTNIIDNYNIVEIYGSNNGLEIFLKRNFFKTHISYNNFYDFVYSYNNYAY